MKDKKRNKIELLRNLHRLGVSQNTWYNWASGRTPIPQYIINNEEEFLSKFLKKEIYSKYYEL